METYRARSAQRRQIEIMKRWIILSVILFLVVLFVIFLLPKRTAAAKNDPTGTYCIISVEIEGGDSLWSIATEYFTDDFGSLQSYINEIKRMNGLSSETLYAGAYLLVPCYK